MFVLYPVALPNGLFKEHNIKKSGSDVACHFSLLGSPDSFISLSSNVLLTSLSIYKRIRMREKEAVYDKKMPQLPAYTVPLAKAALKLEQNMPFDITQQANYNSSYKAFLCYELSWKMWKNAYGLVVWCWKYEVKLLMQG